MAQEEDKYQKLREDLKGHLTAIAKQLRVHPSYISLVLNSKRKSEIVIKAALEYAKTLKLEEEKLNQELKNYNELRS